MLHQAPVEICLRKRTMVQGLVTSHIPQKTLPLSPQRRVYVFRARFTNLSNTASGTSTLHMTFPSHLIMIMRATSSTVAGHVSVCRR